MGFIGFWIWTPPGNAAPDFDYAEARSLIRTNQWAEAAIALRPALLQRPVQIPAVFDLAGALVRLDRRSEALSALARLAGGESGARKQQLINRLKVISRIFVTQETFQIYSEGLNLLGAGRRSEAKENFLKALDKESANLEILIRLGQCLLIDGDFDSAVERLKVAQQLNPFEPEVQLWLGRALMKRGELTLAVNELRSAQAQLPKSELGVSWLAEAYAYSGQKSEAIEFIEQDLQKEPLHLLALLTLARLRYEQAPSDLPSLWGSKKDLQLILSRIDDYTPARRRKFESELGFSSIDGKEIAAQTQLLLQEIEAKIERLQS